jgi:predicted permease
VGRIPEPPEGGGTLLLGYDLWVDAYDGERGVVGRVVTLDGVSRTVTGVLPPGFAFPFNQSAWTILDGGLEDEEPLELVGRLAPGASLESAQSELSGIWSRGDPRRTQDRVGGRVRVDGFTGGRGERGEGVAFMGLVMVALALLLIACANVANLILSRATERVKDLAVQCAVGASRTQIGLQLFLEALLIALLGGLGGVFLAWLAVGAIERTLSAEHFGYFWMRMAVDGKVLAFTSVLVLGTAVVAGLLPVFRVLKADLQGVLKEETAGVSLGGGGAWSRGFVTVQLALSCGALVAAGLTAASLIRGASFGEDLPGEETILVSLSLDGAPVVSRLRELEGAVASLHGVDRVAASLGAPGFFERWSPFEVEGGEEPPSPERRRVFWNAVTPGYLTLFSAETRLGRGFSDADGPDAPPVAVVSESFVRLFLSDEDPLGRRISLAAADPSAWLTIVGVVEDIAVGGGPAERKERVYLPLAQFRSPEVMLVVRSKGDPREVMGAVRGTVARVDPGIPVFSVRTLADAHAYLIRVPRAMAAMALGGGLAGLVVAVVGLYGLLAFRVRQRRKELGVRLALGADGVRLARDVLSLAVRQLLPALVAGLAMAWIAAPLIAVALLGGNPRSPLVYLGVAGAFLLVGIGAALRPALRAAALDPAQVLRGE